MKPLKWTTDAAKLAFANFFFQVRINLHFFLSLAKLYGINILT